MHSTVKLYEANPNVHDGWSCKGDNFLKNRVNMADMDHLSICSSYLLKILEFVGYGLLHYYVKIFVFS